MNNTLLKNKEDYINGSVTKQGFGALSDAENYDQVSSISAGANSIAFLWKKLESRELLSLYWPSKKQTTVRTEEELEAWCKQFFPSCYEYYLEHEC